MVERKLGRGLQFLMSDSLGSEPAEEVLQAEIGRLIPNRHQPRTEFLQSELAELAQSIKTSGLLQPILVRRQGDRFEIIAGERRFRAAKMAGLIKVPVLVRDVDESRLLLLALVENLQRADLNPIEKARAFKEALTRLQTTQDDIAQQVGLSRAAVANMMRLLELPDSVQALVSRGTLPMGHARALLALADSTTIERTAEQVVREGLTVRAVEALVQATADHAEAGRVELPVDESQGRSSQQPTWLQDLERTLSGVLGARVEIRYGRKSGRIVIHYRGRDEFDRVYAMLSQRDPEARA